MRFTVPAHVLAVLALALFVGACQPGPAGGALPVAGDVNQPGPAGGAPPAAGDVNQPGPAGSAPPAAGDVNRGRQLFQAGACGACHALSGVPGAVGTVGPGLDGIGTTATSRGPGTGAETYIRESIENSNAFIVPGFPSPSPMPPRLAFGQELDDLVAFLLSQR